MAARGKSNKFVVSPHRLSRDFPSSDVIILVSSRAVGRQLTDLDSEVVQACNVVLVDWINSCPLPRNHVLTTLSCVHRTGDKTD